MNDCKMSDTRCLSWLVLPVLVSASIVQAAAPGTASKEDGSEPLSEAVRKVVDAQRQWHSRWSTMHLVYEERTLDRLYRGDPGLTAPERHRTEWKIERGGRVRFHTWWITDDGGNRSRSMSIVHPKYSVQVVYRRENSVEMEPEEVNITPSQNGRSPLAGELRPFCGLFHRGCWLVDNLDRLVIQEQPPVVVEGRELPAISFYDRDEPQGRRLTYHLTMDPRYHSLPKLSRQGTRVDEFREVEQELFFPWHGTNHWLFPSTGEYDVREWTVIKLELNQEFDQADFEPPIGPTTRLSDRGYRVEHSAGGPPLRVEAILQSDIPEQARARGLAAAAAHHPRTGWQDPLLIAALVFVVVCGVLYARSRS